MTETNSFIQVHYGRSHHGSDGLTERIMKALEGAGVDTSNPNAETFYPVDQLHGGGLGSTKAQAELAGVMDGMEVLDAGCGIGGGARFLAHAYNCRVEAIDLTDEYVIAARELSEICGLADRINYRQGDVTDLPYGDEAFDLVWCQNVTMNVEDKSKLFAGFSRVLRPEGRLTFSHAVEGTGGEPYYPLPWAREPHYSFPGTKTQILDDLERAGFTVIENRSEGGASGIGHPPGALGASVAMGADMPERSANLRRSISEGRLEGMLVVAEKRR